MRTWSVYHKSTTLLCDFGSRPLCVISWYEKCCNNVLFQKRSLTLPFTLKRYRTFYRCVIMFSWDFCANAPASSRHQGLSLPTYLPTYLPTCIARYSPSDSWINGRVSTCKTECVIGQKEMLASFIIYHSSLKNLSCAATYRTVRGGAADTSQDFSRWQILVRALACLFVCLCLGCGQGDKTTQTIRRYQ